MPMTNDAVAPNPVDAVVIGEATLGCPQRFSWPVRADQW